MKGNSTTNSTKKGGSTDHNEDNKSSKLVNLNLNDNIKSEKDGCCWWFFYKNLVFLISNV